MTSKNTELQNQICAMPHRWCETVSRECSFYQFEGLDIVTSPYEMFCNYGIELGKVAPGPVLFMGLTNGLRGYLPCDETDGIGTRGNEYRSYYEAEMDDVPREVDFSGMVYVPERCGLLVGNGTQIMKNAVIRGGYTRETQIGSYCMIMPDVHIGHDAIIGDHVVISPQSVIGGYAEIGDYCKLRIGALIRPGVKIAPNVTIGMGSVVTKDLTEPGIYYGIPARLQKGTLANRVRKFIAGLLGKEGKR